MLNRSSKLIFKWFLLFGYIYLFDLFPIEPLIVHLYLNDVVLILDLKGYLDCVWRIVPLLHTVLAY
jgi:hypothetical protein